MLVQRDKEILKHIERFGAISIMQTGQIFFKDTKHYYDLARKRLLKLEEMGLVKYYTNHVTQEKIYYIDKKMSPHDLIIMSCYSNLIYYGSTISVFQKEKQFLNGNIRADAFIRFTHGGYERIAIIEVDLTHSTRIEKYEELFLSNELQEEYGTFPLIIVIGENKNYKSENFEVVYLDYKFNDFSQKVLVV